MSHKGSCHCGRVRFVCELDPAAGRLSRDGSMGVKGRLWLAMVPTAGFDVLRGETALNSYECGDRIRHYFCAACGIAPFVEIGCGPSPGSGQAQGRGLAVNLACLDDITPNDWAAITIQYDRAPAVTTYL